MPTCALCCPFCSTDDPRNVWRFDVMAIGRFFLAGASSSTLNLRWVGAGPYSQRAQDGFPTNASTSPGKIAKFGRLLFCYCWCSGSLRRARCLIKTQLFPGPIDRLVCTLTGQVRIAWSSRCFSGTFLVNNGCAQSHISFRDKNGKSCASYLAAVNGKW